ncbi:FecR family protein [Tunicatimonas pelagia]|uniref:FecR family protein n=1 Tax=Tunicatimonas pelagia TaxID=931531 RepID=UPI002665944F|nr:FecR domain-containing protein [Tunicatimonas pelagia]WKN45620.1 FecR domain-containing protein [Tunicatimonas pelagia]
MSEHHNYEKEANQAFRQLDQRLREEDLVPNQKVHTFQRYWIAAAVLVIILASAALWPTWFTSAQSEVAVSQIEKSTLPGQRTRFQLPDGTKVYLNADSRFTYPSAFAEQRIVYLSGEAFLEVAHDADRPFIVRTEEATVQVLGTSFNVKAHKDQPTEAVVVSGKVAFNAINHPESRMLLQPNDKAVLNATTGETIQSLVDATSYTAWTNGTLIFDNQPLGEVFTELARWYGMTITVENPTIRECRVTAKFDDLSLATVLDQLQFVVPITYQLEEKRISIGGDSCEKEML